MGVDREMRLKRIKEGEKQRRCEEIGDPSKQRFVPFSDFLGSCCSDYWVSVIYDLQKNQHLQFCGEPLMKGGNSEITLDVEEINDISGHACQLDI